MTTFLNYYLEILKTSVLSNAGFKSVAPGDCRIISLKIFEVTKHSISETTLKRVYGFAYSKFRPSLFTIDAMAKYCGYEGWDDFCLQQEAETTKTSTTDVNWEMLKHNAAKISNFTLQALKNKAGIPYNLTIKRQFITQHFDEFVNGGHNATLLSAPAGYGKTIALCHWVDEALAANLTGATNDIILFFSSNALMNVFLSGRDLNDWLLGLLGYSTDKDFQSLIDSDGKHTGKFYLIIDGLDEHNYKSEQFYLLLNQVNDIAALHKNTPWFKLILTMRSATWVNNKHLLDSDNDIWYKGFFPNDNGIEINVPLFSLQEIKKLCISINPGIQNFMAIDIADNFNHPLYFQFYYKQHKDDFSLIDADHVCIYELISTFILNKVYLGQHATEKLLFLTGLIELMDFKNNLYDLDRLKANPLIKQYGHAYHDLLSVGFLREINTSDQFQYKTVVQFGNHNFLDYSIARCLLQKNDNIFDEKLIAVINDNFAVNNRKLMILKWCVIYAAKTGQQNNFEFLAQANLSLNQKSDLLVFLGELLDKACSPVNKTENIIQYFKKECSDRLFNYFFGIELLSPDYKKTLQTLLKFNLNNKKKILTYTSLATIAALQLNIEELAGYVANLKSIPDEDYRHFDINPLHCLDAIYQFFKNGIIRKSFFRAITRFNFEPPVPLHGVLAEEDPTDLVYLVAGYGLAICRSPNKTLRYINTIKGVSKTYAEPSAVNRFFLEILAADSFFMLNNHEGLLKSHNIIAEIYQKEKGLCTPFMRSVYYNVKIKLAILENYFAPIAGYLKIMDEISQETGIMLARLFIITYLYNSQHVASAHPQLHKQAQYDYYKILRSRGLNTEIFVNPEVVN